MFVLSVINVSKSRDCLYSLLKNAVIGWLFSNQFYLIVTQSNLKIKIVFVRHGILLMTKHRDTG